MYVKIYIHIHIYIYTYIYIYMYIGTLVSEMKTKNAVKHKLISDGKGGISGILGMYWI
jgi:hypothetical protein